MSNCRRLWPVSLFLAFLMASASADSPVYSWGAAENGLRIGLAKTDGASSPEIIRIAFENTSDPGAPDVRPLVDSGEPGTGNLMLNLGELWNHGTLTIVKGFTLVVTNPEGSTRKFASDTFIAGGFPQAFQVPLPVGATYQMRCPLRVFNLSPIPNSSFMNMGKTVFDLPSGAYKIAVEFKRKPDDKSPSYPFWSGTATSGNIPITITQLTENPLAKTARTLALVMNSYANDHDGKYPHGQSSTEVFQQLIDQSYVTDPSLFYFPMKGKTKPEALKLKPENVCWDVTDGSNSSNDSHSLPVVFSTGYKIEYVPGGKVHALKPELPDIALGFKDNSAAYHAAAEGSRVIDSAFDPKGKTYRQLTPDGPLP
jgi:hypothetical protein